MKPALLPGTLFNRVPTEWLPRLVGVLFAMATVFLLAGWLAALTAPRSVARMAAVAAASSDANNLQAVEKLFGRASQSSPQMVDGLSLVGVFAGSLGGGFATFNTRTGPVSVFAGGEILPGILLKRIDRSRVVILASGITKELALAEGGGQRGAPPAGSTSPAQPAANPPAPLPPVSGNAVEMPASAQIAEGLPPGQKKPRPARSQENE